MPSADVPSESTTEGTQSDEDELNLFSSLLPAYSLADWVIEQCKDFTLNRVMVLVQELDDIDLSDSMLIRKYYGEKDALFVSDNDIL